MAESNYDSEAAQLLPPQLPAPLYFKIVLKEVRERSKLCDALSAFIEDYAHTEEVFGKGLVKAGSNSLAQSKSDWPSCTNGTWNNICVFTEKLGKQHIGYATCLSQSVARSFVEHGKDHVSELNAMDVKIQGLYYELMKTRSKYERNYAKYVSLVQDAENSIKARDNSVHDYANKGVRETELYDGFLKRSVTKMKGSMQTMGKFGPADALRKLDDRCLAQMEEIDISEDSLSTAATVCNEIRNDLMKELVQCTERIETLEKNRLDFMKEGLSRFCQACQGMLDHVDLLITEQIEQAAAIDFEAEVDDLQLESIQVTKSGEGDEIDPYLTAIAVIDKLKEGMDAVKALIQRSTTTMTELSDAGKKFSKNCNRLVDRHVSAAAPSKGSSLSDTAAMLRVGPAIPYTQHIGALLGSLEAPHVRKGWELSISSVSKFAEAYQTGAEVITEKCCSSTESLQKRIDTGRKEMLETLTASCKRVDTLQKSLSSTSNKLRRVRRDLDGLRNSTGTTATAGAQLASSPPDKGYLSGEASEDEGHVVTSKFPSPPLAPHSDPGDLSDQGPTKPQKQRSGSMMLPSLSIQSLDPLKIGSKLGAAVGFESASDRKVNRISTLEDDETRLVELESLALVSLQNNRESTITELGTTAETSKQNLSRDLLNIKMVLQILMDCHRLSLEICQKVVLAIKAEYEAIDTTSDFEEFLVVVRATCTSITEGSSSYTMESTHTGGTKPSFATFEIPPEEVFVAVNNSVVAIERQNRAASALSATHPDEEQKVDEMISVAAEQAASDYVADNIYTLAHGTASPPRSVRAASIEGFDDLELLNHATDAVDANLIPTPDTVLESPSAVPHRQHKKRKSKTKKTASFSSQHSLDMTVEEDDVENGQPATDTDAKPFSGSDELNSVLIQQDLATNSMERDNVASNMTEVLSPPVSDPSCDKFEHEKMSPEQGVASPVPSRDRVNQRKSEDILSDPTSTPDKPVNPFYAGPVAPTEETHIPTGEQLEKTLESFSCALYPKRGMMTHGRVSVTTKNLMFAGWPECRVIIPLHNISAVEKTNSLMIIPNALLITVNTGEEFFFGSFMERELCYTLLNSMVEVSKGLQEIAGPSEADTVHMQQVQVDSAMCKTISEIDTLAAELSKDQSQISVTESKDDEAEEEISSAGEEHHTNDFESILNSDGVVLMHTQELPVKSKYIWKHFWRKAEGYRDYLVAQGDKDVTFSEWEICSENPPEDLCKLKYLYSRKIDFYHPRTDPMVGFMGPANASAQQIQYLFVDKPWQGSDLTEMKYHCGIIFTVTQFTHIPMADVFKVLQYWSFEPKKGIVARNNPCTIVCMYVGVHYNKYTMLKSKILSGTKDDLTAFVKAWTVHVVDLVNALAVTRKKVRRRRKSSIKGDQIGAAPALTQLPDDSFAETNRKVDRIDAGLKELTQKLKSDNSTLLTAVYALVVVSAVQFALIFRIWSRS